MKGIQLFQFEDFVWFPNWLRICLIRMMVAMHKLLNTAEELTDLVKRGLHASTKKTSSTCVLAAEGRCLKL